MRNYMHILFDLDGTLTESGDGIIHSVQHALEKMGIVEPDTEKLKAFIGPPLTESFCRYYDFTAEQAEQAVVFFREYFAEKGLLENRLYDGIPAMLSALRSAGKKLYVATSKPEAYTMRILSNFGIMEQFDDIAGATFDESRAQKDQVIAYLLNKTHLAGNESVLMVGDRKQDVEGAARHGIPCIGVLYGYGFREELLSAGAAAVAESPKEVVSLLTKSALDESKPLQYNK